MIKMLKYRCFSQTKQNKTKQKPKKIENLSTAFNYPRNDETTFRPQPLHLHIMQFDPI